MSSPDFPEILFPYTAFRDVYIGDLQTLLGNVLHLQDIPRAAREEIKNFEKRRTISPSNDFQDHFILATNNKKIIEGTAAAASPSFYIKYQLDVGFERYLYDLKFYKKTLRAVTLSRSGYYKDVLPYAAIEPFERQNIPMSDKPNIFADAVFHAGLDFVPEKFNLRYRYASKRFPVKNEWSMELA